MDKEGHSLLSHPETKIVRHVKVKGTKSPYDGDTIYWTKRMGKNPELSPSIAKLLKKQNGKCNWCNLPFQDGDLIERDHIEPKALHGNKKNNLQLLHKHCHDSKTRFDLAKIKKHKSRIEWNKTLSRYNSMKWIWINDIPYLEV